MAKPNVRLPGLKSQATPASEGSLLRDGVACMTITATEAQNEFGRVLEQTTRDQVVVITRHNVPRAVLVSVDRYRELLSTESTILNSLTDEFDAMLARMQTPEVRAGTERGFAATPEMMGKAAQAAARKIRKDV
ncbi:MAG: type II toxin-antitoxin system prevent-host-death family antitoxin [Gemmatimonadaceae bacterium]